MRQFTVRQPGRQYVFRRRGDRRRMALRLAHGMAPEQVAAVERMRTSEVEMLLGDERFADLVQAHRELLGRSPEDRMAQLRGLALDLLQLALLAGDVRAALFFAQETRAGRDPSHTLAEAVEAAVQRHGLAGPSAPPGETPAMPPLPPAGEGGGEGEPGPVATSRRPLSRAERCLLPDPPEKVPTAPRRLEADFPWCAATQPDAEAAVALAHEAAARVEADHRATLMGFAGRLLGEYERAATALPAAPAPEVRAPTGGGRKDPPTRAPRDGGPGADQPEERTVPATRLGRPSRLRSGSSAVRPERSSKWSCGASTTPV